ncbi:MAG: hypothetical protein JSS86_06720 [Cyanobacteria bacterium SZAS LIN-2]|nr:hypothetical protein [Cyanobacteria bacterium SZAS LIN-3]MBS1995984.1 hypothetical protein [Cyanobacteria bacterium SZAS LIN-2]MBS2007894.1 hypothetical protein [Cyanobacteria bacterium SZAS TMP-1]
MAEMHALRSTTDGAGGISGRNLHCLNSKKTPATFIELKDQAFAEVTGECKVTTRDHASVKARGKAIVDAGGHSEVMATDNVEVYASDNAKISALGRSVVFANDNCTVEAYEGATIFAGGNCRVKVVSWGAVTVHLADNARIDDLVGKANILHDS